MFNRFWRETDVGFNEVSTNFPQYAAPTLSVPVAVCHTGVPGIRHSFLRLIVTSPKVDGHFVVIGVSCCCNPLMIYNLNCAQLGMIHTRKNGNEHTHIKIDNDNKKRISVIALSHKDAYKTFAVS